MKEKDKNFWKQLGILYKSSKYQVQTIVMDFVGIENRELV